MPDWLKEAVAAGPAVIFATMWWLERLDRKEANKKLETLSERTLVTLTELKGMLSGKRNGA